MLLAVATQMLPLLALVGFENVQKNAIYHGRAGNGRWPVSAGGREEQESANMANRRDRRPTFEGSRGVRYQNIANRRDERPTFVKNSRLASTV